jgi:hypothetical protein
MQGAAVAERITMVLMYLLLPVVLVEVAEALENNHLAQ